MALPQHLMASFTQSLALMTRALTLYGALYERLFSIFRSAYLSVSLMKRGSTMLLGACVVGAPLRMRSGLLTKGLLL